MDVTEFKYYDGQDTHKLCLFDCRIVNYAIDDCNDMTHNKAASTNPDTHPLLHSDIAFQYTNREGHVRLQRNGITQSMLRVIIA